MQRFARWASYILLLGPAAILPAWNSSFLSPDGGGGYDRVPQVLGGRTFQLDDYSYCGYKLSAYGLGDGLPCNSLTLTASSGSDITSSLAAAVTTVAALGGGTVYLPAGSFTISSTIWLKYSDLRIAGAGSASTTLVIPSSYTPGSSMYYEAPLSFNAGGNPWTPTWMQEGKASVTTSSSDIPRGGLTLTAGSTAGLAVGDWVVLQQLFWPALSNVDGAGTWPTTYSANSDWQFTFTYVRRIAAISGSMVTLDAPPPRPMLNSDQAVRLFKPNPASFIQNVGLEGVSIQVMPNANNTGADAGRPAGIAVNFASAFNAWCRDVKVLNIAKHGFQPCWSVRCTFLDCAVTGAQDMGGGGWGYGFVDYCSQESLYKRCVATDTRHGFTHQYPMTSDVVMTQCQTLKPVGVNTPNSDVDDTHFAYCHHVLWDQHYQQNTGIQAMNRGTQSGAQTMETLGGGVVWNYDNDGETLNWQADKVQISPVTYTADSDGLVIGVQNASAYDDSEDGCDPACNTMVTGTLMTGAAPQVGPRGNVAYEGLGVGGLSPASLFDGLLFTRLGHVMPPEVAPDACGPSPTPSPTATATPSRTGSPSPSPSATPSPAVTTPTPTASPAATWGAEKQLDAYYSTTQFYTAFNPAAAGSALALAVDSTPGDFEEGTTAVRADFTFNATAGGSFELYNNYGTSTLDLSFDPYGLSVWVKASAPGDSVRLMLYEDQAMSGDPFASGDEVYASPTQPLSTGWTRLVFPYSSLTFYAGSGGNGVLDLNRIGVIRLDVVNTAGTAHGGSVWFDDLRQLTTYAGAPDDHAALNGAFFQLWNSGAGCGCGAWTQAQWDAELAKLHAECQDTVIVQYGVWDNNAWYTPSALPYVAYTNPTLNRIFQSAQALGMKVVVGLDYSDTWAGADMTQAATYSDIITKDTAMAAEVVGLFGANPAFAGWYIPQEVDDLNWQDGTPQLPLLRAFLQNAAALAKAAKPLPVYIAPFYGPHRPADDYQAWWAATLAAAPSVDWVIPQDGASGHASGEVDVPHYFAAMKAAVQAAGRNFGATVESFHQTQGWPINGNAFASVGGQGRGRVLPGPVRLEQHGAQLGRNADPVVRRLPGLSSIRGALRRQRHALGHGDRDADSLVHAKPYAVVQPHGEPHRVGHARLHRHAVTHGQPIAVQHADVQRGVIVHAHDHRVASILVQPFGIIDPERHPHAIGHPDAEPG